MSGNIATHEAASAGSWVTTGRAARELGLKPSEFDLAVDLGRIRTTPDERGAGRRVDRAELERLRARPGRPEALRESVRTVGATEGALLMGVTKDRFTRLARLGLLAPTRFHLNRHRAVVWLYLAEELRQFTADERNTSLLRDSTSDHLRGQLDTGLDLRARNWRTRRLAILLRRATDPWSRAGALASLLDPTHICEVVKDPYERSHLSRFRPERPSHGAPGSPGAILTETLVTAQDSDEIAWLQAELVGLLAEAREHRPAPRPASASYRPAPAGQVPREPERPRGAFRTLLARWRGRNRGPAARRPAARRPAARRPADR
ncbi:DUF6397 family protein [Streptomyces hirsutus]|uniref:DUF6397 family protein n=1 Tax=Streptomyces hirsutus TaxID=35620 RepID=A0ABZ1GIW0_9ACTN|nr:DUF6397 family protein [Streptomyces hirsutus]WSD05170.1 DUF6397 family protein [Streptomyces hirsutus]